MPKGRENIPRPPGWPDDSVDPERVAEARIVSSLLAAKPSLVIAMAAALESELLSADPSPGLSTFLPAHCGALVDLFVQVAAGHAPTDAEVDHLGRILPRAGGPQTVTALVRAVRAETGVLRERLESEAGQTPEERSGLYALGRSLEELSDALLYHLIEASFRREAAEGVQGRRQLLETMLLGRYTLSEQIRARAAGAGIDPTVRLLVIVATAATTRRNVTPEHVVRHLIDGLVGGLRRQSRNPFAVARGSEVVAVIPAPPSLTDLRQGLEAVVQRLGARLSMRTAIGISAPCAGLIEVPVGYDEASRMLRRVVGAAGVVSASEISLIDYLVLQTGGAARRIVSSEARLLVQEDRRWEGALIGTLSAYLDNDLSVERTAAALSVHANTVYYRLGRITRLTGVQPRNVWALVDLLAGVQILRTAETAQAGREAPLL